MIDLNDFIIKTYSSGGHKRYRCRCDKCGKDKGYQSRDSDRKHPLCTSCGHQDVSEETKEKMSKAKKGKSSWNKGIKGVSEETSEKMRKAKEGFVPWNKGGSLTEEERIHLS